MDKKNIEAGELLFKRFDQKLKEQFKKEIKNFSSWNNERINQEYLNWHLRGEAYNRVKSLLRNDTIDTEVRYIFLKEGIKNGYRSELNEEYLLTSEIIKHIDFEYLWLLIGKQSYSEMGYILSYLKKPEILKALMNHLEDYYDDYGIIPRNIASHIELPKEINYCNEVAENQIINNFNIIYNNACINAKMLTMIRNLEAGQSENTRSIKYLNQDNLISLAKGLFFI